MAALTEAMYSAEGETDLLEYVRKVKAAVIASVEEMNPGVRIEDTGHFNHSAAPDLVLTWPGRKGDRPLYVRRSYQELEAGHDVQRLAPLAPIFLSVGPSPTPADSRSVQRPTISASEAKSVLVTNAATVDLFAERDNLPTSPLTNAVAAKILHSGQGLLDESKARPVLEATPEALDELVDVLSEEALLSVTEVAAVVSAARGAEVPQVDDATHPFTTQEAADLLPWLLQDGDVTDDPSFWKYIASRTTLKHLEDLADELQDLDLSRLCGEGWSLWSPQRGYLGLNIGEGEERRDGWFMNGRLLTYQRGAAAFRFATYGQALKERGSVSSATWEAIQEGLTGTVLRQIALRGLARVIRIDGADSGNLRDDVDAVVASVEDRYYVDEVTVQYGTGDEERLVRLALGDQLAHNLGKASIRDVLVTLARIGAYRDPVDLSELLP